LFDLVTFFGESGDGTADRLEQCFSMFVASTVLVKVPRVQPVTFDGDGILDDGPQVYVRHPAEQGSGEELDEWMPYDRGY
jgi:hypothetical protein